MPSKQHSLNKRIRETISGLSDEKLIEMQRASGEQYTSFARKVLEEELKRRRTKGIEPHTEQVSDDAATSAVDYRIGCYIDIWDRKNFEGEHMRIEGPSEYQTLEFPSMSWSDSISSIRVGPNAFVLLYADNEFRGKMKSLGPNQEVSNLKELRFNNEVDSLQLINSVKIFDGIRYQSDNAKQVPIPQTKANKKQRGKHRRP